MRRFLTLAKSLVLGLFAIAPGARADKTVRAFVVVYDGWGAPERFTVSGRVLEDQGEHAPDKKTGEADNLVNNLKALESDEVAGAEVKVQIGGHSYTATTDDDGVFLVEVKGLKGAERLPVGEASVIVDVLHPANVHAKPGVGKVFVLDDSKPFTAVISDVDDTIVKTYVTEKRKLLGAVLLKNSAQLEPVEGAARNYQKARDSGVSAFFYVSGSPQNFHRRIHSYIEGNGFPQGPLLLKNFGADNPLKQEGYKAARIDKLLEAFPLMSVVLVGDSGEKDPEIYREAMKRHPGRVRAIVIRKTASSDVSDARFAGITAVDDRYASDDVIAKAAAQPLAPPAGAAASEPSGSPKSAASARP
jgi:phosphatidate phosphatase APP1